MKENYLRKDKYNKDVTIFYKEIDIRIEKITNVYDIKLNELQNFILLKNKQIEELQQDLNLYEKNNELLKLRIEEISQNNKETNKNHNNIGNIVNQLNDKLIKLLEYVKLSCLKYDEKLSNGNILIPGVIGENYQFESLKHFIEVNIL